MEKVWSERNGPSQTTHVRVLLASWGLYVDLTAQLDSAEVRDGWPADIVRVGPHLGLDVRKVSAAREDVETLVLTHEEVEALVAGFKQRESEFPVAEGPQICVIRVETLSIVLTDYQPEAVTIAASAWASDLFEVERAPFEVKFDRPANRYRVTFHQR